MWGNGGSQHGFSSLQQMMVEAYPQTVFSFDRGVET
jgi:hypothetical protein